MMLSRIKKIVILFILTVGQISVWAEDYQMTMFGIKSDGITMNTRSIQKAIDFISEKGGGRLVFTVGRYLTGSIHLKSNVVIHLKEGAVLVGSTNPYDYDKETSWYALVLAKKQENIGITGKGMIDGRGRELANNFITQVYSGVIEDTLQNGRVDNRPNLIYFRECKNVEIKDVTMENPASWTQAYDQCENLFIDGITVHSRAYWNNDGINIVDCNNVLIQNSYVDATDDAICLKSHSSDAICQNIEVRNNTICSSASGIKFGTASYGGFKDIKIVNNTVFDTFRSAIAIEAVDGGQVENVIVDSLRSIHTGNPIYLVVGERREGHRSQMNNVHISNVYAEVPLTKPDIGYEYEGPIRDNPRNTSPSSIIGMADNKITNVSITNVELVYPGGGNPFYAKVGLDELDKVPEIPEAYPEFSKYKELPAWGFYVRHVDGVVFKNVKLTALNEDYRLAIVLDDVSNGSFTGIEVKEPSSKEKEKIYSYKSTNIEMDELLQKPVY